MAQARLKFGLVLGGGAARGWAHLGVIRSLQQAGLHPDLVCGTSIGALVGAALASGELDRFEHWVRQLRVRDVVRLMDIGFGGGLLKGDRLVEFFNKAYPDRPIADLGMPFGAVATDLRTGAEVWLKDGSTLEAVRASIALPGLLSPKVVGGRTLVDGVLVNPVPVSLARAMGADVVLAVNLNADLIGRHLRQESSSPSPVPDEPAQPWFVEFSQRMGSRLSQMFRRDGSGTPSMFEVVTTSVSIMQVSITRSRMASEPPDVTLAPKVSQIGIMEFHRAAEAIEAGQEAAEQVLPALRECLGPDWLPAERITGNRAEG